MPGIRWVFAALITLLATACGGGGGDDGTPTVDAFSAETGTLFVGERARLTATFRGGSARIEPDIGPVTSGVPVQTPPLAEGRRYTLVVEAAGQPAARRTLDVAVRFRDRHVVLGLAFPVQYHAAVPTGDGAVLVFGGSRGGGTLSDAIDRFDPATGRFQRIGTLRTGRAQHTATRLADGSILVVGGVYGLPIGNMADVVDERSGAVAVGGAPVQPRVRHAAVALADGRVLVVGGLNRATAEIWDPATRRFRLVAATMRHPRDHATATLLADGRVLIVGGGSEALAYTPAELFDPRTETFTPVASPLPERRQLHAAARLPDGRVLIAGGEHTDPVTGEFRQLASTLVFDPVTNTLSRGADLDTPRSVAAALAVGGELLLFGGSTPAEPAARTATAQGAAPRRLAALPEGRLFHTATRLGDGRVLIVGGDDADGNAVPSVLLYE